MGRGGEVKVRSTTFCMYWDGMRRSDGDVLFPSFSSPVLGWEAFV